MAAAAAKAGPPLRVPPAEAVGLPTRRSPSTGLRIWRGAPVVLPRVAAIGLAFVASLLVAGLVVVSVLVQQAQDELDAARAGQREIAEYLRNGGTVTPLVSMQGDAAPGVGRGSLVVAPGQAGALLVVDGLLPSATDRSYRVWVARAGDRTRVDELRVGSDGTGWLTLATAEPLVSYDAVGITVVNPDTSERQDLLMAPIPGGAIQ
ncbi:MAG: anti-sigma factor [Chloroflexota bacterium]|nr:anti-sigma factor [Chloroflexota bacterium]